MVSASVTGLVAHTRFHSAHGNRLMRPNPFASSVVYRNSSSWNGVSDVVSAPISLSYYCLRNIPTEHQPLATARGLFKTIMTFWHHLCLSRHIYLDMDRQRDRDSRRSSQDAAPPWTIHSSSGQRGAARPETSLQNCASNGILRHNSEWL